MTKRKIAVLTTGWSVEYINCVLDGIKSVSEEYYFDIYIFITYRFLDQRNISNVTGYNIYSIIDYKDFDGVIILSNIFGNTEILERERKRIIEAKVPAVSLIKELDGIDTIYCDNMIGFKKIIEHMYFTHKCTDFAYIGGSDSDPQSSQRYEAFMDFIKENNIKIKSGRLFLHGDWSHTFGRKMAEKILENKTDLPEVVVCANDLGAIGAMSTFLNNGVMIPDDIKVIGFDNINESRFCIPSLSTVSNNSSLLGKLAVMQIFEKDSSKSIEKIKINSEPILRQSCGCKKYIESSQIAYNVDNIFVKQDGEFFNSQLRHLEEVFTVDSTSSSLIKTLSSFFEKSHEYEGKNFSIMLKNEIVSALTTENIDYNATPFLGDEINAVINIVDDTAKSEKTIKTKNLICDFMKDDKCNTYIFVPLVFQDSLDGYFVCKNETKLLETKRAYTWTKYFSSNIEKFLQKSKYKEMSRKFLELSTKDALSGLLNRAGLDYFGKNLFNNAQKLNRPLGIIFIDINSMKIINDKHGHLHGDLAVKIVAKEILNHIPKDFIAIRYGGDEFVILGIIENNFNLDTLNKNIYSEIIKKKENMSLPYNLSISSGFKIFNSLEKISLEDAICTVDKIMYENKKIFHTSLSSQSIS